MRQNFGRCLALTFAQEGGYSDHPLDPGGATNFGVTQATLSKARGRAVTKAEVRALSRDEAAAIYRQLYWAPIGGDDLPSGVDVAVFDHAVNSGPAAALRTLRAALGLPLAASLSTTLAASANTRADALVRELCRRRMSFLRGLRTFPAFGRGWTRRVDAVQAAALKLIAVPAAGSKLSNPNERGDDMMINTEASKPFWASQTIWSAFAAIGSSVAGAVLAWRVNDFSALGAALTAIAGGAGAIIGRVRAKVPIA